MPSATAPATPEEAALAAFAELTDAEQQQQVATLSAELEEQLLAPPGQEPDPAIVKAYRQVAADITRLARAEQPELSFGRTGGHVRAEDSTLGGLWFGSLITAPLAVTIGLDASQDTAADKPDTASRESSEGKGSSSITVKGALDHVTVDWTMASAFDDVKGTVKIKASMDPCPDANGMFRASITSAMAGEGAASTSTATTVDVVGLIDDNANLLGYDSTARTQAARGTTPIADVTTKTTHAGGELTLATAGANEAQAGTAEEGSQWSTLGMINQAVFADQIIRQTMAAIEKGRCVRLTATPTPANTKGVQPSSPFSIDAKPRSLVDGQPTGGTVTATLSGGSSVNPAGTPVPADAQFAYVAPDEENQTASVALEARSIRGVGKAAVGFDTAVIHGWVIGETVGPYHYEAVSCSSAAGPWKIVYELRNMAPVTGGGTINVTFPSVPTDGGAAVGGSGTEKGELKVPGGGVRFGGPVQATLTPNGSQYTMTLTSTGVATGYGGGKQASKEMVPSTSTLAVRPATSSCQ